MMKTKILLLTASLFIIAVCQAQEITEKNYSTTAVKSQKMAEAPKKVYIRTFKIYYQMIAEAEKTSYGGRQFGGGSYTGDATARLAVGVEGISPEDLQKLTDGVYESYVAKLSALGLEIMTAKEIPAIEYYEGWQLLEGPRINQEQIKGSLMVVPSGYNYFVADINKKGKEKTKGFMSGVTSAGGKGDLNDFMSSAYGPVPKISKDLDDAIVVDVAINVPSIYLDPKSNLGAAKVKGGAYLRIENAKISYISGKEKRPGVAFPTTYIEMLSNKPIVINGVFKAEEFKAVATKSRTTIPDYGAFFTVEDKTVALTNTIECEADVYIEKVSTPINELLDISLDKLSKAMQGEKVK